MRDLLEPLVDAETGACGGSNRRCVPAVEEFVEFSDGKNVGQIVLVVLKHDRHVVQIAPLIGEVVAQIVETFEVRIGSCGLCIGDENDSIRAREHEFARGVEVHLTRHREQLQAHVHPTYGRQPHREEIEVQRPIDGRCQRDELAAMIGLRCRMNVFERGRLSAKPWPVVDDLENEFPRERVYGRHKRTDDIISRGVVRSIRRTRCRVHVFRGGMAWAVGEAGQRMPTSGRVPSGWAPSPMATDNATGPRAPWK